MEKWENIKPVFKVSYNSEDPQTTHLPWDRVGDVLWGTVTRAKGVLTEHDLNTLRPTAPNPGLFSSTQAGAQSELRFRCTELGT